MAGVALHGIAQKVDGKSFVPTLRTPARKVADKPLIFHYPHKWTNLRPGEDPGINYHSAIRYGKWKLVYNMRSRTFELYDLSKDIGERRNLASVNRDKVKELAALLGSTLKARGAQMPISKESGNTVPFPDEVIR